MGRIIRVLIYATVIIALYLVVTTYVNSCQDKSVSTSETGALVSETDTMTDNLPLPVDSSFEANIDYHELDSEVAEIEEDMIKDDRSDQSGSEQNNGVNGGNEQNDFTQSQVASGGKYLVMAGSYLIRDNAESMMSNLIRMGFTTAEVVVFNNSQYHTVLAGRFNNEDKARQMVDQLRQKGIESYVKAR